MHYYSSRAVNKRINCFSSFLCTYTSLRGGKIENARGTVVLKEYKRALKGKIRNHLK
jgi:hypothetical protein